MGMRRCITCKVHYSDAYVSLPYEAQSMYTHMVLSTDDEGFVIGTAIIVRLFPNGKEMLQLLMDTGFVLCVDDVFVIAHHRVANSLKNDRIKALDHPEVAKKIWMLPNRVYTVKPTPECKSIFDLKHEYTTQDRSKVVKDEAKTTYTYLLDHYPKDHIGDVRDTYHIYSDNIHTSQEAEMAAENLKLWLSSSQWHQDGGRQIPDLAYWLSSGMWKQTPYIQNTQ